MKKFSLISRAFLLSITVGLAMPTLSFAKGGAAGGGTGDGTKLLTCIQETNAKGSMRDGGENECGISGVQFGCIVNTPSYEAFFPAVAKKCEVDLDVF